MHMAHYSYLQYIHPKVSDIGYHNALSIQMVKKKAREALDYLFADIFYWPRVAFLGKTNIWLLRN